MRLRAYLAHLCWYWCTNYAGVMESALRVTMSSVGSCALRPCGYKSFDLAHSSLDVARIPMDAVTELTDGKVLVRCIYKRGHATDDRLAANPFKQMVARGATRKGVPVRIEWIPRHHLTHLLAEQVTLDIEHVR